MRRKTPPESFTEPQKQAWADIVKAVPAGVLTMSDVLVVETASRVLARVRTEAECSAATIGQWRGLMASLGLTPADRARVGTRSAGKQNRFARFA